MTTFKMDESNLQVLIATADLGAMAFAYSDEQEKTENGCEFASTVERGTGDMIDSFEDNNHKVTLSKDDYIVLLIAVRGAFEAFMSLSDGGIKRMLRLFNKKFDEINQIDRKKMAHTAHILLDFLECHATNDVLVEWIEERKNTAIGMLEVVTDAYRETP